MRLQKRLKDHPLYAYERTRGEKLQYVAVVIYTVILTLKDSASRGEVAAEELRKATHVVSLSRATYLILVA